MLGTLNIFYFLILIYWLSLTQVNHKKGLLINCSDSDPESGTDHTDPYTCFNVSADVYV